MSAGQWSSLDARPEPKAPAEREEKKESFYPDNGQLAELKKSTFNNIARKKKKKLKSHIGKLNIIYIMTMEK